MTGITHDSSATRCSISAASSTKAACCRRSERNARIPAAIELRSRRQQPADTGQQRHVAFVPDHRIVTEEHDLRLGRLFEIRVLRGVDVGEPRVGLALRLERQHGRFSRTERSRKLDLQQPVLVGEAQLAARRTDFRDVHPRIEGEQGCGGSGLGTRELEVEIEGEFASGFDIDVTANRPEIRNRCAQSGAMDLGPRHLLVPVELGVGDGLLTVVDRLERV